MSQKTISPVVHSLVFATLTLSCASATVTQTNLGTGDRTTPGGAFVTTGNLLSTNLENATRTGSFYRETSGYAVSLSRLFDGVLGSLGSSGLGGDGAFTVMPNIATIQFDLDGPFDLTTIRTYASWDDGRSGQGYEVKYATADDPLTFISLHTVANWNNVSSVFPLEESSDDNGDPIMVPDTRNSTTLTILSAGSGFLAENVVSLQFVFNGYQNGGTAYREFQVEGSPVTLVPEPSVLLMSILGSMGWLRRSRQR